MVVFFENLYFKIHVTSFELLYCDLRNKIEIITVNWSSWLDFLYEYDIFLYIITYQYYKFVFIIIIVYTSQIQKKNNITDTTICKAVPTNNKQIVDNLMTQL